MAKKIPVDISSGQVVRMVENTDYVPATLGGTDQPGGYSVGDILVASGAGTLAKLGVGSSGQVPTSNGTTLVYQTPTASEQQTLTNDEAGALIVGNLVYSDAAGGVKKAKADALSTSRVIGLALTATASSGSATIQCNGVVTLTTGQWDAAFGTTGGLTFNTPYYLSAGTAGLGTATPPDTTSQQCVYIGVGLSTTKMRIGIQPPLGL